MFWQVGGGYPAARYLDRSVGLLNRLLEHFYPTDFEFSSWVVSIVCPSQLPGHRRMGLPFGPVKSSTAKFQCPRLPIVRTCDHIGLQLSRGGGGRVNTGRMRG